MIATTTPQAEIFETLNYTRMELAETRECLAYERQRLNDLLTTDKGRWMVRATQAEMQVRQANSAMRGYHTAMVMLSFGIIVGTLIGFWIGRG
jgi:hypothetical protein